MIVRHLLVAAREVRSNSGSSPEVTSSPKWSRSVAIQASSVGGQERAVFSVPAPIWYNYQPVRLLIKKNWFTSRASSGRSPPGPARQTCFEWAVNLFKTSIFLLSSSSSVTASVGALSIRPCQRSVAPPNQREWGRNGTVRCFIQMWDGKTVRRWGKHLLLSGASEGTTKYRGNRLVKIQHVLSTAT